MQVACLVEIDFFRYAFPGGNLPLHTASAELRCGCLSRCWSTIDPVHNHTKNDADVVKILGRVTQALKSYLVSNASLLGVKEPKKV